MMVTGKPGDGPMRAGAAVADMTAGLFASLGLMTALLEREVSGKGQWVQSNLLQAQIALLDFQAARYLMKGEVPGQVGNDHPTGMPTSAYQTKDGWLNIAATGDGMYKRLCVAFERADLFEHDSFNSDAKRSKNREALNAEINRITVRRSTAEWVDLLNKAGVPSGPINTMDQVFADPQVQHLEAAATVQHPRLGELRVVNQAVKLSRTPATMARATPELGEHNEEVLRELGYGNEEVADFRARKVI
jgi:crotonobetainyl-CoA:carnitine CoA-transferase CaiB-like acyl-CoA transferase